MTLQEILDEIAERYPHALQPSSIVNKINYLQAELFRLYQPIYGVTFTTYDIIQDNPFYPIEFAPENLVEVVVNGENYDKQSIRYDAADHYYYLTEDNCIGLYPTPSADSISGLTAFHYKEPALLSASNLGATPDFDRAWHMLFVYHVCHSLAAISRDGEMAAEFAAQYNSLEQDYKRVKRAKPHKIKDVYGAGWGH